MKDGVTSHSNRFIFSFRKGYMSNINKIFHTSLKLYIFEESNKWWGQWILGEFRDLKVKVTVVLPVFSILTPPASQEMLHSEEGRDLSASHCSQNVQLKHYFYWGLYKIVYLGEWDFMHIHECEKKRRERGKLISFCIPSMGFEKNAISDDHKIYYGYIKCFYFIYSFINTFNHLSCSCLILCQIWS